MIAAPVLLALFLGCNEGRPPAVPTSADTGTAIAETVTAVMAATAAGPGPATTADDGEEAIAAAVAKAVATAMAGAPDDPTPDPSPTPNPNPSPTPAPRPTPTVDEREEAIAAAVAKAVATLMAGVPDDPTPKPSPSPTSTVDDGPEAGAVATAGADPTPTPAPSPGPAPSPIPTPKPSPSVDDGAAATATAAAAAKINAEAEALHEALRLALDYYFNSPSRGNRDQAIAYAVSMTNTNTEIVGRAFNEALGSVPGAAPLPVDPAAKDMSDAVAAAVTLALQYIIHSPNDREGAVAHAVAASGAGVDANAVAGALDRVLNNPIGFPNIDTETAVAAANAVSEATAIAATRARVEATIAANKAAAEEMIKAMATATPVPARRYDSWNDHEWLAVPKPWWRESKPYDCDPPTNPNSPWTAAGMPDLGGQDPLSLIRWFGNGSYVRYGLMGFEGCAVMSKYPDRTHLDMPADPAYYSLGNLEIAVDIARVPADAPEWPYDDGARIDVSMAEAVNALNDNIAAYFRKISQGKLQMTFAAGEEFQASGRATPQDVEDQWLALIGVVGCDPDDPDRPGCRWGIPGALNRILLNDVGKYSGGSAWNGYAELGLVSLQSAAMTTMLHEIGHAWMFWPHSYTELPWRTDSGAPYQMPNPYSSRYDFMSELNPSRPAGWYQDMPTTLAVNRYAAGWIEPDDVALHLSDAGTYRLARPRQSGYQFLVIHSGRPGAFTTLEVLDERNAVYRDDNAVVLDPASPGGRRPMRYEGVMVSRYDQTTGTGYNARTGPALYDPDNPNYESDVGYGRDDFSVIADGESRSIGGGINVSVTKKPDGSYDVAVSGGRIAEYRPWCIPIWFSGEYDDGCMMEDYFNSANGN